MTIEQLMELRASNEAPFNHQEYTVWLHNKIIEGIRHELYQLREEKQTDSFNIPYYSLMYLKSLQLAK